MRYVRVGRTSQVQEEHRVVLDDGVRLHGVRGGGRREELVVVFRTSVDRPVLLQFGRTDGLHVLVAAQFAQKVPGASGCSAFAAVSGPAQAIVASGVVAFASGMVAATWVHLVHVVGDWVWEAVPAEFAYRVAFTWMQVT